MRSAVTRSCPGGMLACWGVEEGGHGGGGPCPCCCFNLRDMSRGHEWEWHGGVQEGCWHAEESRREVMEEEVHDPAADLTCVTCHEDMSDTEVSRSQGGRPGWLLTLVYVKTTLLDHLCQDHLILARTCNKNPVSQGQFKWVSVCHILWLTFCD